MNEASTVSQSVSTMPGYTVTLDGVASKPRDPFVAANVDHYPESVWEDLYHHFATGPKDGWTGGRYNCALVLHDTINSLAPYTMGQVQQLVGYGLLQKLIGYVSGSLVPFKFITP